ncbi:DUF3102 domain-containing protein, partial [Nitrospiraceae bacterium AH_259_D15_M11_P09]|nr:DUF3102 domain-containing protein [Nitrospiraceae bacterium AH_259_D15_M11_P09]
MHTSKEIDEMAQDTGEAEQIADAWAAQDQLEIMDAERGGYKVFTEVSGQGSTPEVLGFKSTAPNWYKDITRKKDGVTPLRRAQVDGALQDIIDGEPVLPRQRRIRLAVEEATRGEARKTHRYTHEEIWPLLAPAARSLPAWTEPDSIWAALDVIKTLGRSLRENAYMLGKTLIWAKARVGHGNFLPWLRKYVRAFTRQTAATLMKFASECDCTHRLLDYHPGKCKTILHSPPAPADTPHRRSDAVACS